MLMLKALRHPGILRLWLGQVFSTIGDEIYRVGLTWLAVGLIGENTGYLSAAQAASLMIMSFVGGKWADQWAPMQTMIRIDQVRAAIVLVPVVVSFFIPVPLVLLVVMAVILSGLGAFFDPALQTTLPSVAPDTPLLRAATGLMGTTIRLARMVGPAIVGILFGVIAPIHFFTMDAITFAVSAWCVSRIRGPAMLKAEPTRARGKISFKQAVLAGFRAINADPNMRFVIWAKAVTGSTWNLAYGLGFALLVQSVAPGNASAFGFVVAGYGLGNFLGALYYGNLTRPRPGRLMNIGFICLGLGFVWMAWAQSLKVMAIAAAFTGFTGTANEVTFFDLVQSRFPLSEMTRIFRLRMAMETAATLALMLLAPILFRVFGVRGVIGACGAIWMITGLTGLGRSRLLKNGPIDGGALV